MGWLFWNNEDDQKPPRGKNVGHEPLNISGVETGTEFKNAPRDRTQERKKVLERAAADKRSLLSKVFGFKK